jgi:hypothetical protein
VLITAALLYRTATWAKNKNISKIQTVEITVARVILTCRKLTMMYGRSLEQMTAEKNL